MDLSLLYAARVFETINHDIVQLNLNNRWAIQGFIWLAALCNWLLVTKKPVGLGGNSPTMAATDGEEQGNQFASSSSSTCSWMSFSFLPFTLLATSSILVLVLGKPFTLTLEKREQLGMLSDCEHDWGPTSSKQYMHRVVRTQVTMITSFDMMLV